MEDTSELILILPSFDRELIVYLAPSLIVNSGIIFDLMVSADVKNCYFCTFMAICVYICSCM